MSSNCILIDIFQSDIDSATGNTYSYLNNKIFLQGVSDPITGPEFQVYTIPGDYYYCYEQTGNTCTSCVGSGWMPYDGNTCYRYSSTTSTPPSPSNIINMIPAPNPVFSVFGTLFYSPGFDLCGSGATDSFINTGSFWINFSSTVNDGPLNRCGIWTSGLTNAPFDTWLGFSTCLVGLTETKTYYVGIAADNEFRLVLDGVEILNSYLPTSCLSPTSKFNYWRVYPITINPGDHVIEVWGLNSLPSGTGAFGCEIYDNDLQTLTAATSLNDINIIFTTSGKTEVMIIQDTSGNYLSSGYTCPSGYVYDSCTDSCIQFDFCSASPVLSTDIYYYENDLLVIPAVNSTITVGGDCPGSGDCVYNITGVGSPYNDRYFKEGIHNDKYYWEGKDNGNQIYYSTGDTEWCLSNALDGPCYLFGPSPSFSDSPNFSSEIFGPGVPVTPTPTPTLNCSVLNFDAIFNCFVTPTPSITPTNTPTPTVTPTPSSTPFCQFIDVNASITAYTPTPTPTMTPTPSSTTPFTVNCTLNGNVTFNIVNSNIVCPVSYIFEDCLDGNNYSTVVYLSPPSGGTLTSNMVFSANVNGQIRCIKYIGTQDISSNNSTIQLLSGPYSTVGNCASCLVIPLTPTPTPTNTSTPTPTPTLTPTPTATSLGTSSGRFDIYVDIQSGLTPLSGSVWYSVDNFIDNLQPYPTSFTWTELSNGIYDTCGTNTFVGSIYVSIGDNVYLQVRDGSNTIIYKHKAGFLVPSVFDPCNNPLVSNDYFTSISSYGGPYPTTADIKLVVLNPLSTSPTPP